MRGGDGIRLAKAEFMEIRLDHPGIHAFRLVDRDKHRALEPAQHVGNFLVVRRQPGTAIDDENDGIRLGDRLLGLARHFVQDAILDQRLETAGIDHQIRLAPQFAMAVMAVARQAGQVGDDGVTRPGQPVEQCRFAYIGPPDQNQCGFH